jgi:hypothetical protein
MVGFSFRSKGFQRLSVGEFQALLEDRVLLRL